MADEKAESAYEALKAIKPDKRREVFQRLKRERENKRKEESEENRQLPNSHWSKLDILERIPNPPGGSYEQKIYIPEFSFLGVGNQPDYGSILFTFYPNEWTIELKSLKQYKDAFRNSLASYERLAQVIYEDLINVYEPLRLRMTIKLRPRGGISSCLTIDSDWAVRGGKEQFSDWKGNVDEFGFSTEGVTQIQ